MAYLELFLLGSIESHITDGSAIVTIADLLTSPDPNKLHLLHGDLEFLTDLLLHVKDRFVRVDSQLDFAGAVLHTPSDIIGDGHIHGLAKGQA